MPTRAGASEATGRWFVIAMVVGVLVLWASLYVTFRHWRTGYRQRQAFGAQQVATAIDPLAEIEPAGGEIPREAWRKTVAETHAMLVTLTASNVLDQAQLNALRQRVRDLIAQARPANARAELASLWDELEAQAGPIVQSRHPRPALLPPFRARNTRR